MAGATNEVKQLKARKRHEAQVSEALESALAAVAIGNRPTRDDLAILDDYHTTMVTNPYDHTRKVPAVMSLRDDPLGRLHKRHQIDDAQLAAGRQWQADYEAAEVSGARAIDTTKEAVDGGGYGMEFLTDRQVLAIERLGAASKVVGMDGEAILRDVLARRMSLAQIAQSRGLAGNKHDLEYLGRRFRDCLEMLGRKRGLIGNGGKARRHDDEYAKLSINAGKPALHVAVRRAQKDY